MHAAQRGARHGKETKRILVAQVGLAGDRQAGDVGDAANVVGRDAERGEPVTPSALMRPSLSKGAALLTEATPSSTSPPITAFSIGASPL
jgi:hypothetical protein